MVRKEQLYSHLNTLEHWIWVNWFGFDGIVSTELEILLRSRIRYKLDYGLEDLLTGAISENAQEN
jgi:hypothetical protein